MAQKQPPRSISGEGGGSPAGRLTEEILQEQSQDTDQLKRSCRRWAGREGLPLGSFLLYLGTVRSQDQEVGLCREHAASGQSSVSLVARGWELMVTRWPHPARLGQRSLTSCSTKPHPVSGVRACRSHQPRHQAAGPAHTLTIPHTPGHKVSPHTTPLSCAGWSYLPHCCPCPTQMSPSTPPSTHCLSLAGQLCSSSLGV